MRKITVIAAGLSQPSSTRLLADRLSEAVKSAFGDNETVNLETFELRDYAKDITNAMLMGFAPPALNQLLERLYTSDGIITVTPIFNTSYSGLFKMFMDITDPDRMNGVPVLMAATGGTPRHSLALDYALRPLFNHLHMPVMTTGVYAATEDWGAEADKVNPLGKRINRAGRELAEYINGSNSKKDDDGFDGSGFLAMLNGE